MEKEQPKAYNQLSQSAIYKEDEISVSLTVCGGSYGGGSEVLIVQGEEQSAENGWSVMLGRCEADRESVCRTR